MECALNIWVRKCVRVCACVCVLVCVCLCVRVCDVRILAIEPDASAAHAPDVIVFHQKARCLPKLTAARLPVLIEQLGVAIVDGVSAQHLYAKVSVST